MKIGMFLQPLVRPEHTIREIEDWCVQSAVWADRYGLSDVFVGEHHSIRAEPIPCPDILVAAIIRATETIRVGTAGFVLPFYHPAHVANRVSYLDHLSHGRFNFGIANGSVPPDFEMFGIDFASGAQRAMSRESLQMILKLWAAEEPETFKGEYWTAAWPKALNDHIKPWLKPYQKPHPPISIAGATPHSSTLQFAGELGLNPMSIYMSQKLLASHWASYEKGCAISDCAPERARWSIACEVIVAETDEKAQTMLRESPAPRMIRDYQIPLFRQFKWIEHLKEDSDMSDEDVTADYYLKTHWIVGSPETVVRRIESMSRALGGFGKLIIRGQDFRHDPESWRRMLELVGTEVLPGLAHLDAAQKSI